MQPHPQNAQGFVHPKWSISTYFLLPTSPPSQHQPRTCFPHLKKSTEWGKAIFQHKCSTTSNYLKKKKQAHQKVPGWWHNALQIEFIPGTPTYLLLDPSYNNLRRKICRNWQETVHIGVRDITGTMLELIQEQDDDTWAYLLGTLQV